MLLLFDCIRQTKEIVSEGTYNMGDGETPSVAESRALLKAKQIALEQAGTYVESYSKIKNITLIWLTVVKEKTVSPPLRTKGMISVIAPGHDQRRDLSATIDHSDIRGFDRMTCLHRGAVSL